MKASLLPGRGPSRALAVLPVIAFAILLQCGCATTSFNVQITLPSRAGAMQERQRVVVGGISGPYGYELARMVSEAISTAGFHTLIDRANEEITAEEFERNIETGEFIDASKVGATGATVVISGETNRGTYSIERERRVIKKCVQTNDKGECIRSRKVHLFDQRERCDTTVSTRVTRVVDNVVLFERGFSGYSNYSQTTEGDWPSRHESELCSKAFGAASSELVTWITPFSTVVRLVFHNIKDSPSTKKAIDFVQASMFDRASGLFEAALSDPGLDDEDIGWARYNIAVIRWALGDYQACVDQAGIALDVLGAKGHIVEVRNSCVQYAK